jgi:L-cystine uptake protein TcyP (sodium:dicarboxylate symporter family)
VDYIELVLIPVLIGILEAIKRSGFNSKFIPILSIIIGIVFGIFYSGFNIKEGIITGIYIGLSAVGLYSGTKSVIEEIKQ